MKNLKSLEEYIKEKELHDIKDKFDRLTNYKYGDSALHSENDSSLFLVLDEDDDYNSDLNSEKDFILEYDNYQSFPPTKCVYRLDKSNNIPGQQVHVHVYSDKKHNHQLYAINIDGTPHDGSKFQLSQKHQDALKAIGFTVPKDGLLEWISFGKCKFLLLD